ncbi:MAG: hypothetical protein ACFFD4_24840 [Candidatus Odinarchaeota archaeon]
MESYIKIGRLVVLLQFFAIPLYFFLLAAFAFPTYDILTPELSLLTQFVITPLTLAFPLLLWTWVERYAISDAYELMGDKAWRIPTALRIFYGFNFMITLIFLLPLGAPFLALTGGYFLGLLFFGVEEGESQISRRSIKITTFLYGLFALVIGLIFFVNIIGLYTNLYGVWVDNLDFIYRSALSLADAVAIGSVIYVFFEIRHQRDLYTDIPRGLITVLSIALFVVLETLLIIVAFFNEGEGIEFLDVIHWVVVIVTVCVVAAKFFLVTDSESDSSVKGWLSLLLFQLVGILEKQAAAVLRSSAIFFAFVIFALLFIMSYYQAKQRF